MYRARNRTRPGAIALIPAATQHTLDFLLVAD